MRLSPAAEFAVRGVVVLARQQGQGPVTLDAICNSRELPKQYLVKIFASLAKAELVIPVRGKKGGYLLARPPEQISLLEVIEAVEGPIVLNFCQATPSKCDQVSCLIRPVWTDIQQVIRQKLSDMKISDCLQGQELNAFAK